MGYRIDEGRSMCKFEFNGHCLLAEAVKYSRLKISDLTLPQLEVIEKALELARVKLVGELVEPSAAVDGGMMRGDPRKIFNCGIETADYSDCNKQQS
ncbi:MAG: hypothetical protein ACD_40C00157G0002 [uncultured bacterium]|nr:MAG: hypothetical protein ACD_40C00157G0002 [uncultured bacterium]